MEIKKSGFVYQVAYGLTDEHELPYEVSLCRLFWKFMGMFFVGWPIIGIIVGISFVVGFFFARRAAFFAGDPKSYLTIPYKVWPRTASGKRIWPIWFVLGGGALWLLSATTKSVASTVSAVKTLFILKIIGTVAVVLIIVWLAVGFFHSFFFQSEAWQLAKAYCKAKKEKVCPIIKVVE